MEKVHAEKETPIKENGLSKCVLNIGKLKLNLYVDVTSNDSAGLVIRSYYPLEPGDILDFKHHMEAGTGIVKWSIKEEDNNFIAGVNFVKDQAQVCCI